MKKEYFGVIALLIVFAAAVQWRDCSRKNLAIPTPEQRFVEIIPEQALFDNMNVRVVIAAKIRPGAPVSTVEFVHVGGYFLDQTGTSYSPGFSRVNNRGLPTFDEIQAWERHILRTGETYRYCLGPAAIDVDQSSDEAAANAIKSVTVYLDGRRPINVPVRRWRGLDLTSNDPNNYR